jgi:general secretion pathway protein B
MSYILQALKKSQQERELAAQVSTSVTKKASYAAVEADDELASVSITGWLIALFSVLMLIAGYVYQQAGSKQSEVQHAATLTENDVVGVAVAQKVVTRELAVENGITSHVIEPALPAVKEVMPIAVIAPESPQVVIPKMPVEQAAKEVQSLIPNIDISSHIYSSMPARRSIVVNGERLVETDFITPHVQVKEITHQGMIIDVDGLPLVVDRSRGWSR